MNCNSDWRFQFASELSICRPLNGMWQVSGAHGRIDLTTAIRSMFDYADAGFTTWDLADHCKEREKENAEIYRKLV